MSKRVLVALLVILSVVTGGYYVMWQRQGAFYLDAQKAAIAQLNSAPLAEGLSVNIASESTTIGGFPFRHTLTYHHPAVTISLTPRAFALMMASKMNTPPPPSRAGDDVPITYRISADGDADLALHYFTTHVTADIGGVVNIALARGEDKLNGMSDKPQSWHYDIAFRKGALKPLLGSLIHQQQITLASLTPYLSSISYEGEGTRLIASDTKEPLSAKGSVSFAVDHIHLDPNAPRLHLRAMLSDYEVFDRLQRFIKALTLYRPVASIDLSPFEQHETVGKSNLDIDIGVASTGSQTSLALGLPMQGQIDAKKIRFSNNLFQLNFPFFVEINDQNGLVAFKVQQAEGSLAFSAAFDTALEQSLRKAFADKSMREQLAAQFGAADKADTLSDYISDVLPKVSGFGTIKTAIDLSGNTSYNASGSSMPTGNVELKKFHFSTDPYALGLAGSYDAPSKQGFLTLDCTHCPQLIADGVEYNNRVQRTLVALNPARTPFLISPQFYDAIVTFLTELNTNKEKDVLSVSIKAAGDGNVTISGKPASQVMMTAIQRFAPLLSTTSQPTASQPTASQPTASQPTVSQPEQAPAP